MTQDYQGEPNASTRILIRWRLEGQSHRWRWDSADRGRLEVVTLLALKTEEEAISQGVQRFLAAGKGKDMDCFLQLPKGTQPD